MEYPGNFETPAFPAGKSIAISRVMAIGSLVLFVIIVFLCVMILWTAHSRRVSPIILSIDNASGQWVTVGAPRGPAEYSAARALQESVVARFVMNWFLISTDGANGAIWARCERDTCADRTMKSMRECAIYCASDDVVFDEFENDVVPGYRAHAAAGDRWRITPENLELVPLSRIGADGAVWRARATVQSLFSGPFDIVAFVHIARNVTDYPQTMGYYVSGFNAYRVD